MIVVIVCHASIQGRKKLLNALAGWSNDSAPVEVYVPTSEDGSRKEGSPGDFLCDVSLPKDIYVMCSTSSGVFNLGELSTCM
jgi:hypothetical protein